MKIAITAFLACMIASAPCLADDGSNAAAAEELFSEGRKLMAAHDYAAACPKLEASERLDPGAGTLLNLAGCYEGLGRTASAWATYADAESAADRAGRPDWRKTAHDHAETLFPTLSRLTINVTADARGLVVERDGETLDAALYGRAVPVDPGVHLVTAHAPGRAPFSTKVNVAPRADNAKLLVPSLAPADPGPAAPNAAPAEAPPSDGSARRTIGVVVGSVGLASLVTGAVLGLVAKSTYDDALSHECRGHANTCSGQGVDDVNSAHSQAAVSTVFFIAGGALLATGAVLFFTAPRAHVQAYLAPAANGLFLGGSY